MAISVTNPTFHVLTSLEQFESYSTEYRTLFDASNASPYFSYEWLHAFLRLQSLQDGFYICIAEDDEGPFAAIPLIAKQEAMATWLKLLADGSATHNTGLVLARGRDVNIFRQACAWLHANHLNWDYCAIDRIPEDSGLYSGNEPVTGKFTTLNRIVEPTLAIDLPESWDDYLAGLSKRHRNNIRRTMRKLEIEHQVRMVRAGLSPEDESHVIETLIEDALNVSRRSWQGKATHGVAICDQDTAEFFRQSSRSLAQYGMLDLALLYIDERAVAFTWGATRNGLAWVATAGFDAELGKLGLGMVLDALVIRDSIQRGMIQLDWGDESAEYKQRWCNRSIPLYEVELYAKPRIGKLKRSLQARWNYSIKPRIESWQSINKMRV